MNMMYFFERLRFKLKGLLEKSLNSNRKRRLPDLNLLEKLISRCLKMYVMIDDFMSVFKLLAQKRALDSALEQAAPLDMLK